MVKPISDFTLPDRPAASMSAPSGAVDSEASRAEFERRALNDWGYFESDLSRDPEDGEYEHQTVARFWWIWEFAWQASQGAAVESAANEQRVLNEQVGAWAREIVRLGDLIAFAQQPSAASPAAQASYAEDTARLDFMIKERARVFMHRPACWQMLIRGFWCGDEHPNARAAIDAAIAAQKENGNG